MNEPSRREFLQSSSLALAVGLSPVAHESDGDANVSYVAGGLAAQITKKLLENEGKKPLRLGLIIGVGNDPDAAMAKVHELELPTCQVYVEQFEAGLAGRLRQALDKYQIEATSLVVGGPGKEEWDFYNG